jgi:two-component system OmpR family response regulator
MSKRVLIVEDDAPLARVLRDNLAFVGFEVEWVADADAAVDRARNLALDLIILDVMLPGRNGFELCGLLRQGRRTPIIFLTARSDRADKLAGLNLGADDYVTKPFDLEELLARVRAVLRRASPSIEHLVLGPVTIDFTTMVATRLSRPIHLTHREFELLHYLAERRGRVVHRDELLREIWLFPDTSSTRAVDNTVARLRKKIEPSGESHFIHTVHGDGYCLTPSDSHDAS